METTKTKKRKSKKVNQVELYKRYFIFNEFEKNIEERLIYDLNDFDDIETKDVMIKIKDEEKYIFAKN